MGRHEKTTKFVWDDAPDNSFTEAEILRLRAENNELKKTIRALERDNSRLDRANDRAVSDKDAAIEKLKKEVNFWKYKAMKLVEAHV